METPPPPPKWVVDLRNGLPAKPKNVSSIPDPPGYSSSKSLSAKQVGQRKGCQHDADVLQKSQATARKPPTELEMNTLKLKKAWEIALGPAKQIPMQAIMMYMSGNSLQIFSIMMVYMLCVVSVIRRTVAYTSQIQESHPRHNANQYHLFQIRECRYQWTSLRYQSSLRPHAMPTPRLRDLQG